MPASRRCVPVLAALLLLAACGGDGVLCARVRTLLQAHANPGSFLVSPACDAAGVATLARGSSTLRRSMPATKASKISHIREMSRHTVRSIVISFSLCLGS